MSYWTSTVYVVKICHELALYETMRADCQTVIHSTECSITHIAAQRQHCQDTMAMLTAGKHALQWIYERNTCTYMYIKLKTSVLKELCMHTYYSQDVQEQPHQTILFSDAPNFESHKTIFFLDAPNFWGVRQDKFHTACTRASRLTNRMELAWIEDVQEHNPVTELLLIYGYLPIMTISNFYMQINCL